MSDANLQNPIFTDETKAREWLETRVWPTGVVCPHCGNSDKERIGSLQGKAHRSGLYQCEDTAHKMAHGFVPDCLVKEGHQRSSGTSFVGYQLQINLVHDASLA
jgi:hypothetical protein